MSKSTTRLLLPLLAAGLFVVAACSDHATGPSIAPPNSANLFRTHCEANVRTLTVLCASGDSTVAAYALSTSKTPAGASLMTGHIFGGQGIYVNLVSSGVTYSGGLFKFNTTIQNIANLSMATSDGVVRDDNGIQVFFQNAPVSTNGPGAITVDNVDGTATFLATNQRYYQYGGKIAGTNQPELGADGILSPTEVSSSKPWQFTVPATVLSFSFDVYASTNTAAGAVATIAPQVTSIAPATLVPGTSATITGTNFNATPSSNTVTIGGRAATVTGGTATTLTVTVPCLSSGTLPVYVSTSGARGASFGQALAVTQRTVALGQALVLSTAADSYCNELTSVGGAARYVVTVFNVNSSPSNNQPFQFSGDNIGAPPTVAAIRIPTAAATVGLDVFQSARQRLIDEQHTQLLDQNAAMYRRLRAKFGTQQPTQRISRSIQSRFMPPPTSRTFRVANLNAGSPSTFCSNYFLVNATLVYNSGKIAIYEDDATPAAFQSALNPAMAAKYLAIGDQFNADMEPIIRNNFGDVLRRDAVLDNNGQILALFTPRINNSFAPRAGFVVSCDQYPNDDVSTPVVSGTPSTGSVGSTNGSSNFGEVFYAYEPTVAGAGYGAGTVGDWYRSVRSTFIHETKHLAAYSARVANGAGNFEDSWLEEGTARHSEELWMRNAVDHVAWKGNTGYGSFANPINVYCDVRTPDVFPECGGGNRPASIMYNHFSALYTFLRDTNSNRMSPFGPSPADNGSYFYAISWSLVRYALDRYGVSDAAFLTALTQATTLGVTNLTARSGVSIDQLLGGWALALCADDYPGLASPSADIQFPTWNLRGIYTGLNADFGAPSYALTFPLIPTPLAFGASAPLSSPTMRGGGLKYFEFSGSQSAAQILRLEGSGGGLPSIDLRIAVARIQ
jgi:hypothetical protein